MDGETVDAQRATAWLRAFAEVIAQHRDELTALDAAIGDADHGVNMDRGMQAVAAKLLQLDEEAKAPMGDAVEAPRAEKGQAPTLGSATLEPLFKTAGMTLVSTVGGAAGPLYGTLLLEIGKAAGDETELTAAQWAEALAAGVAGVCARGKAAPGDKTMLDALVPATEALHASVASGASLAAASRAAADAAAQGMRATTPMIARKGRASYLGERSAGHQDPGATSSWLLLQTAAEAFADGSETTASGEMG